MSGLRRPFGPKKCVALLPIVSRPWAHGVRALADTAASPAGPTPGKGRKQGKIHIYFFYFVPSMLHGRGLRLTPARFSQAPENENERAWVVFVPGLNESRRFQSYSTIRDGFESKDGRAGRSPKK